MNNEQGGVSITALWLLALLSLLTVGLVRDAVVGLRVDAYAQRAAEARWLARAGVYQAISVLQQSATTDSTENHHASDQDWANSAALFEHVECGSGYFEVGYTSASSAGEQGFIPGVTDENRKININSAAKATLARLPGMTDSKVAALMDWRDADSEIRIGGAETEYYKENSAYSCKDAALDFVEELLLVKDFTDDDLAELAPWITVYGEGPVNINTASRTVLTYLGLSKQAARDIIDLRLGNDGAAMTADDHVFSSPANLVVELTKRIRLRPTEQALLNRLVSEGDLGVHSTHFTIQSSGIAGAGQVRKQVVATVAQSGPGIFKIVAWHER